MKTTSKFLISSRKISSIGNGIRLSWLSGTSTTSVGVRRKTNETRSMKGSCLSAMRRNR